MSETPQQLPAGADLAAQIDRHHAQATALAGEAVHHAREAGKLLLQAKAGLKHGEWLPWLAANVKVSARQAQRYIAVAEGKTPAIRDLTDDAKCDTVSHLLAAGPEPTSPDWKTQPVFMPPAGMIGVAWHKPTASLFVIEPSREHAGHTFVSRAYTTAEGDDLYDCTARPVRHDCVELTLQHYGLPVPSVAKWHFRPFPESVRVAFESMLCEDSVQQRLADQPETIEQAMERMQRTADASRSAGAVQ